MNASLITYSTTFVLSNSPEDLTFTDNTPYVANGVALADASGILKITGPTGVFYKNAGWDTDDFSAPDIDCDVSLSKTGIALPFDADGDVVTGEYLVEYKVKVVPPSVTPAEVYTATSTTYNFCFTNPTVDIDMSADCATSILTSTDSTDYDVDCDGTTVSYDSITRTHTLKYPADLGISDISGSSQTLTAGPNIYTNIWTTTISSVLIYTLPCGLIINTTVTGIDYLDVQCDECQCDLLDCIETIHASWISKLGSNPSEADRLQTKLLKIWGYWILYSMAVRCGEDDKKVEYCGEITDLVSSETTCCTEDTDTSSSEVIPLAGGGGGTVSYYNVWYDGTGAPASGLGNNNDYYICSTAGGGVAVGDVYKKLAGTWTYQFSLAGAPGSSATAKYALLNNNLTAVGTDAGTAEKDLMTYTVPADTLDANGEFLEVSAMIKFAANANQKTVKLYWGGVIIETYICTGTVTTAIQYLKIKAFINRTSAAEQDIETISMRQGIPAAGVGPDWQTDTEDLTTVTEIKVTGQNAVATADDIVCEQLKVEHFKI